MEKRQTKKSLILALGIVLVTMIAFILPLRSKAVSSESEKAFVKIKYVREDNNYDGWNIWTWSDTTDGKSIAFEQQDNEGRYIIVETTKDANLGFLIRQGDGWDHKLTDDVKPDFSNGNVEYLVKVAA